MTWIKRSQQEINDRVNAALAANINYSDDHLLGIPASYLDDKVFNSDAPFLKDAPFLTAMVYNPNHIGCHTLGTSEKYFAGTQEIERELIAILSEDIFKGMPSQQDGYVASGGTEANIQAVWIYRNYFETEFKAKPGEIALIGSQDTHYSINKAGNLLGLPVYCIPVESDERTMDRTTIIEKLLEAKGDGHKYFIVICNMMTTMFGSVDDPDIYASCLEELGLTYKIHVDGAFGGFYYPIMAEHSRLTFRNEKISSFTLDAHKMLQAPYGTGVFLIRKGLIHYANTKAGYIYGDDFTLIGSRSGANAIAVWMILNKYGPNGWYEKLLILQNRTRWLCEQLVAKGVEFYRHEYSNIVTMKSKNIPHELAGKYGLVPDNHSNPEWFKIVIMDHVTIERLSAFLEDLNSLTKAGNPQ